MVFGYTPLDPLIVLLGTGLAAWFLSKRPVRLMAYLPSALSLYFFIPTITLLTLWQTVPMLLTARALLLGKLKAPPSAKILVALFGLAFFLSATFAVLAGDDSVRALIRVIYYMGIFALFSFCYEMGRKPEALRLLLRGLVGIGIVLALYGAYQLIATPLGLPVRGILRGTRGAEMAFEYGFVRINSLANEPKRLGYVLFCATLACFALARMEPGRARFLRITAIFILIISLFTFAGSYFATIVMFGLCALVLYPSRATRYVFGALAVIVAGILAFPDAGILEAIQHGYQRRVSEVEIGLDGFRVYRQEFYAWDYLANHLGANFTGVGLGQYFITLYREYGVGVGFNEYGGLQPLNSNFLEILFDLGGAVAVLFYLAILALVWNLRQAGERFLCLALLFVTIQSLTILTLQWMILFAGVGAARLVARRAAPSSVDPAASNPDPAEGVHPIT
ncbi:hypothetical protein [Antarctobacter jejuensis]|uniref:hypothetical protein n=1 Tax=Antarctobacter jejuensis TaxID=1439938 RepID=UPI003FCFF73B